MDGFDTKSPTKVDMRLNKESKRNQNYNLSKLDEPDMQDTYAHIYIQRERKRTLSCVCWLINSMQRS